MVDVTLFELHFEEGFEFFPSSAVGRSDDPDERIGDDAEGDSGGSPVGALVGVALVVVVVGVAIRKLLEDDLEPVEELEELDESVRA